MSLEQLIHTVSEKLNLPTEKGFEKITITGDTVRDELFRIQKLLNYGFNNEEIETILNELIRNNFASRYISYECEQYDMVGIAVSTSEPCEYCGDIIKDSSSHLTDKVYKLNQDFLDLLKAHKQNEVDKYIIKDFKLNLDILVDASEQVIPFLGAGVSVPFGLPNWGGLLEHLEKGLTEENKDQYNHLISRGDFLRALSFLKTYSGYYKQEKNIKKEIKNIIDQNFQKKDDENLHNVLDILKLNSQFCITTNYDNALSIYLNEYINDFVMPLTIDQIEDVHDIFEGKQNIIHLHGHINKSSSMIVTKEDYDSLYSDPKTTSILNSIMGNKKLLFIGFSFNDKYFKDLYKKITSKIGGEHFIIVPNLHSFDAEEYLEINLTPIGVNVKKDVDGKYINQEFIKAIKVVLEQLK